VDSAPTYIWKKSAQRQWRILGERFRVTVGSAVKGICRSRILR